MECMQCQREVSQGRRDRKFCSDKCKHEYHNEEKFQENAETSLVMNILRHNRRVLKLLLAEKEEVYLTLDQLRRRGFNFQFHTHEVVSGQGNRFVLCFNYGYREVEGGKLKVVHWKSH